MSKTMQTRRASVTMVAGTLLSVFCGVVRTFWIPRLLSIDDFGRWRTFILYTGYAPILDLGLVTGALLLWSKDPAHRDPDRSILGRTLGFIGLEHLALIALAALCLAWKPHAPLALLLLALSFYAALFNLVAVLQVHFQAHLRFTPIAFGAGAPESLFVISLVVLASTRLSIERLVVAHLAAWALTFLSLSIFAWRSPAPAIEASNPVEPGAAMVVTWRLGWTYIAAGWPILLAYMGFGVMQSADRIVVSLTRPVHDFAIYSLSQSAVYVPIAVLAAASRVALSYFARQSEEGRAPVYRRSTHLLALLWSLLLPYYFAFEFIVTRYLPKYVPSLPAGRILLLSILFLSLIVIVQLNTYSVEGRQRQFFAGSLVAVAVAFATAWFGSRMVGTLTAVAWSQVVTALLWWLGNEYFLRRLTNLQWTDIVKVLLAFASGSIVLEVILRLHLNMLASTAAYLCVVVPICFLLFYSELRRIAGRIKGGV